jgi:endonuclease I
MMKRCLFVLWGMMICIVVQAQPAAGFYDVVDGKKDIAVKSALFDVVSPTLNREFNSLSYSELWTAFYTTDCRPDGKVWDMYSNITNYTFGSDQDKGSHSSEGKVYNREHSFPKSWFGGDKKPMYTDLFHLYPTDGYVNERRGNLPFGEVGNTTYQSSGGFSKVGSCRVDGYSGIVFEPADEYKGDFARTYFYMVTAYEDDLPGWPGCDMLDGSTYPAFETWAIHMLLRWHRSDPVSQKEIDRNNAVEKIQCNRNPFIDHPVLAEFIWGDYMTLPVDVKGLTLYSNDYDTSVSAFDAPQPVKMYDLTGREVTRIEGRRGVFIFVYTMSDGSHRTRKQIVR